MPNGSGFQPFIYGDLMTFYDDMASMARDLLKPATQGGFGQGVVQLRRVVDIDIDPDNPWNRKQLLKGYVEAGYVEWLYLDNKDWVVETLDAVVRGVDSKMVGTTMGSTVLMASDLVVLAAVPKLQVVSGDTLTIDGRNVKILSVQPIPAAGTMSAIKFFVRG